MGSANESLNLRAQPPAIVLLAGCKAPARRPPPPSWRAAWRSATAQGHAGQRRRLSARRHPAAGAARGEVDAAFFPSDAGEDPVAIARSAVEAARRELCDVLIVDTAGRLHVDDGDDGRGAPHPRRGHPVETLFVVDSMAGQDAVNAARAFGEALELTGVIVTKTDGDARGGVALSVRHVTGKPIKFIGAGEKTTALEPFHPDRLASRILGMGDVVSLVEEVQHKVDREQADKLARKLSKGQGFNLQDLRDQIRQMQDMGGLAGLLDKLPGNMHAGQGGLEGGRARDAPPGGGDRLDDTEGAPHSGDHRRLAQAPDRAGAGVQVQDVNRLLKQHAQMQKMMKKFSKGGMAKMMRAMKGRLPPGFG
jgi:signal recognition particle subunit SRP54